MPSESALATHTRSAQLQDKVEQQQLKKLVLDYEQREEAEEMKGMFLGPVRRAILRQSHGLALEARSRNGAVKIRYIG